MLLRGKDLVPDIKTRQARIVSKLGVSGKVPKLVIIQAKDDPVIDTYVRMKRNYGKDIGAEVEVLKIKQPEIATKLQNLNSDPSVDGIIVQLPLPDMDEADELLNMISPNKDVDGLAEASDFVPATPTAILNLLNGYNIDLKDKKLVLVGRGKLVGTPLRKMLEANGVDVTVVHSQTKNPEQLYQQADVIITATGRPGLIKSSDIKPGTVVVDAGTAGEGGKTVGDLTKDIVSREDIKVSPTPGGVGPLTVCALFEHVLLAANS